MWILFFIAVAVTVGLFLLGKYLEDGDVHPAADICQGVGGFMILGCIILFFAALTIR